MKLRTESYDEIGTLLPEADLEVISHFTCFAKTSEKIPMQIVLGIWIQLKNSVIEPRYLTQAQLDKCTNHTKSEHTPHVN